MNLLAPLLLPGVLCTAPLVAQQSASTPSRSGQKTQDSAAPAVKAEAVPFSGSLIITVEAGADSEHISVIAAVPRTIPGRQEIVSITCTPAATRTFDEDGNRYVEFVLEPPPPKTELRIDIVANLFRCDLQSLQNRKALKLIEPEENLKRWLAPEKYLEVDSPKITAVAKNLLGASDLQTLRNCHDFVAKTVKQGDFDEKDHGAVATLEKKTGDCTDFTDLLVTLCRACGIPARSCDGYLTYKASDTEKHCRAEVHLKDLGWVPIDSFHTALGHHKLESIPPHYLVFDIHRNNPVLDHYHFWFYRYQSSSDVKADSTWTIHPARPAAKSGEKSKPGRKN